MGNGWHEWPLIMFTVLGQFVAGGVIVMGFAWIAAGNAQVKQKKITQMMFYLWVVMGVAFVASIIHLGSPLRAFNSLNRVGHSALSNEIASGSVFFAVGGLWWLITILGKMPQLPGKIGLIITMVLGLFFVRAMSLVYQINTVPTWHNSYTTLSFFFSVLLGGPLLGAMLLKAANDSFLTGRLSLVSIIALLASLVMLILQSSALAGIYSSVQQATALIPDYAVLQVCRMLLLIVGLGGWIYPLIRRTSPGVMHMLICLILILLGEFIGRGIFYGLHMTVGMAVAG